MNKYLNIIELVALSGTVLSIMQAIFWFALFAPMAEGINPIGIGILLIIFSIEFIVILILVETAKFEKYKKIQLENK